MLGEDAREYDQLLNDLIDYYQPVGRAEELEVENIAVCWWKRKRVLRYENAVVRAAIRDVGEKDFALRAEHCKKLLAEEEAAIFRLQKVKEEIETKGIAPQDFKQRVLEIWPKLGPVWSILEIASQERSQSLPVLGPERHSASLALNIITHAIEWMEHLGKCRTAGVMEVPIAQHAIPERDSLDRILRYGAAIGRDLNHAIDRLERLQLRRRWEVVPPPISVRSTR